MSQAGEKIDALLSKASRDSTMLKTLALLEIARRRGVPPDLLFVLLSTGAQLGRGFGHETVIECLALAKANPPDMDLERVYHAADSVIAEWSAKAVKA